MQRRDHLLCRLLPCRLLALRAELPLLLERGLRLNPGQEHLPLLGPLGFNFSQHMPTTRRSVLGES
jgi:hypothetical protein